MNEQKTIRIVIASKEAALHHTLRMALESEPNICVVAELSELSRARNLIREQKPDVVVLDLAFLRSFSPTFINEPLTHMVVVLAALDKPQILESFRLGAQGVVPRAAPPNLLAESIQSVMNGHYWLDRDALRVMVSALCELLVTGKNHMPVKDYGLTRREVDIIAKIANGRSNREIGQDFSISERTVKRRLSNIFTKVGVSSRLQLALFAVNHFLKCDQDSMSCLQPHQSESDS